MTLLNRRREKYVQEWGTEDLDKEDEEELMKTREFDAWKDDNPKGSGNTGARGYKYL